MNDHTNLIARLRFLKGVGDDAADAIEALQAKLDLAVAHCVTMNQQSHLWKSDCDQLRARLTALEGQLDLFRLYSPIDVKRAVIAAGAAPNHDHSELVKELRHLSEHFAFTDFVRRSEIIKRAADALAAQAAPTADIQTVMWEVFEYAKIMRNFEELEGDERAFVIQLAKAQETKIRNMLAAQAAPTKEPLTDEQKLVMLKADSYFHQRESYLQGIEDAEKHHGIGGKV